MEKTKKAPPVSKYVPGVPGLRMGTHPSIVFNPRKRAKKNRKGG